MSRVADWLFSKFVEPMEQEFLAQNGREPNDSEMEAIWKKAMEKAESDHEGRADAAREEGR